MVDEVAGYELLDVIGAGASGTVWRARQRAADGRVVALKRVSGADATALERVAAEARILAALDHPHVVPILECVADGDGLAIAMAYASGGSLADRLSREGPLPWEAALELLAPVADALASAHRRGIVHRDVKPANVLLTSDGAPLLCDFGIAWATDVTGTPGYLDPAVLEGAAPGPLADVYALGVVAYEVVAGAQPFDEEGATATAAPACPPRLDVVLPEVSGAFAAVVAEAMAPRMADRPRDAEELAARLRACRPAPQAASVAAASTAAASTAAASAAAAPPLVRRHGQAPSVEARPDRPGVTQTFGPRPTPATPSSPRRVPWVRVSLAALLLLLVPPVLAWLLRDDTDAAWRPGTLAETPPSAAVSQVPAGSPSDRSVTASLTARTVRVPPPRIAGVNSSSTVPSATTVTFRAEPSSAVPTDACTDRRA